MMTHTYQVTGMTCNGCEQKVKSALITLPEVTAVEVSKDKRTATISMDKHISLGQLQNALGGNETHYRISAISHNEIAEQTKSWLVVYKPLIIVLAFILGLSTIAAFNNSVFSLMKFMNCFMAGFF